jgi:hypothetical protein
MSLNDETLLPGDWIMSPSGEVYIVDETDKVIVTMLEHGTRKYRYAWLPLHMGWSKMKIVLHMEAKNE